MYNQTVQFIQDLFGTSEFIPLHAPCFVGNEKKYLIKCIDSTYVSSVGSFVDRFEFMVAQYTGAAKAVVCVNGTNALHLAMILAGVEREDEVLTQSLTFIATCNAISYIGAHPIFLDVDKDTMGLSPLAVEYWLQNNAEIRSGVCYNINTGRRIKACIPMHTFGHPVHIDKLVSICKSYQIDLIEDAAESLGSFYKGKHTGTFGKISALSFNGNKTITTGGGGMLLFQDEFLGIKAKHLSTQAKLPHRWAFEHDQIGYNYRMPNINAALGCAQMENLELFLKNKRKTAEAYQKHFAEDNNVDFFAEPIDCQSNYWLNAVLLKDLKSRDNFLEYTNNHGVMTRPIWCPMHKLSMFRECQTDSLANTEWLEERVVNLPSSVHL